MTTYSFKDTSGAFTHPLAGEFILGGEIGEGQFTIVMTTDKSSHNVAADGAVMVSFIAGDNGHIAIECQQTSAIHAFLLGWYNIIKTLAIRGDVTNWANAALSLRNIVDGSEHQLTGVSPQRIPDKTYAAQGGMITWTLMAADIQNVTVGA